MMKLIPIALLSGMCSSVAAFSSPIGIGACTARIASSALGATSAETEAERLRAKARELMAQVKQQEDDLHNSVMAKKASKDAHTDEIIKDLFPANDEGGTCDLVGRLRNKRLASDELIHVVERLHERTRVAEVKEPELEPYTDRLIEAAEVLDREFVTHKAECGSKMTHAVSSCILTWIVAPTPYLIHFIHNKGSGTFWWWRFGKYLEGQGQGSR